VNEIPAFDAGKAFFCNGLDCRQIGSLNENVVLISP